MQATSALKFWERLPLNIDMPNKGRGAYILVSGYSVFRIGAAAGMV